jgi:hypothetical protein
MFKKNPIYSDYEGGNFREKKFLKKYKPLADSIGADYPMDKDRGITFIHSDSDKTIIMVDNLIVALAIYYDLSQDWTKRLPFTDLRYNGKKLGYVVRAYKNEAQFDKEKSLYGKKIIFSIPKKTDEIILFVDKYGRPKK